MEDQNRVNDINNVNHTEKREYLNTTTSKFL